MIGGVTRLGGLPGLPGRVTLSAGVTICHVNVLRWGNPPSRSRVPGKKLSHASHVQLASHSFVALTRELSS